METKRLLSVDSNWSHVYQIYMQNLLASVLFIIPDFQSFRVLDMPLNPHSPSLPLAQCFRLHMRTSLLSSFGWVQRDSEKSIKGGKKESLGIFIPLAPFLP